MLLAPGEEGLLHVQGEGSAPGVGPASSQAAIDRARVAILEEITAELAPGKASTIFKPILEHPDAYIEDCQVIRRERAAGCTTVEVAATVRNQRLRNDAAALLLPSMNRPPRVMVLVSERFGPDGAASLSRIGTAETALAAYLKGTELDVVHSGAIRERYTEHELLAKMGGETDEAGRLVRECLADVGVLGQCTVNTAQDTGNTSLLAYRARVEAEVVLGASSTIVESLASEAVVRGQDEQLVATQAIVDACAKLNRSLFVAVVLGVAGVPPGNDVTLYIEDPGNKAHMTEIMQVLQGLPGVSQVEQLHFTPKAAWVRVGYEGPMRLFELGLTTRTYSDFRLHAERVVEREVTLALLPR